MDTGSVIPTQTTTRDNLASLTATAFLDLLKRREISVSDYAEACIKNVEAREEYLKAWAFFDASMLREKAEHFDAVLAEHQKHNAGTLPAAMFGVPVGLKDIFNTTDMPTTHGSPFFSSYRPGNDARVVTNLLRSGSIVAGKTATAEFAVHTPSQTRHPLDPERSVGTSSTGSAAAIAANMVPVALASQTGASTIRPASYCGIYGFKASFGVLPRTAMLKTTDTLDTIGMMSRCINDIELMFDVMRVRGHNYPIVHTEYAKQERLNVTGRPWRIGVVSGPKSDLESRDVKEGIVSLAKRLAATGCEVEEFELGDEFNQAHKIHETIYWKALSYYFQMEWEQSPELFSENLAALIRTGFDITVEAYQVACAQQNKYADSLDQAFTDRFDILLSPAAAEIAPRGTTTPDKADHSLIWTMCRLPTLSAPYLTGEKGLPIGAQFIARRFDDYKLFNFIRFVEEAGVN